MWRFSQHQLKLQKSALHAEERVINPLKAIQTLSLTQMLNFGPNMQNSNRRGHKSAAIYLRITHTFSCCALHLASRLNYLHLWSFRLQSISQSSTILSFISGHKQFIECRKRVGHNKGGSESTRPDFKSWNCSCLWVIRQAASWDGFVPQRLARLKTKSQFTLCQK